MYQDYVTYFKLLAETHISIQHTETDRRFFRMNIEEFFLGMAGNLAVPDNQCILVLIDYTKKINSKPETKQSNDLMFYVLRSNTMQDFDREEQSLSVCEEIMNDILVRMRQDSNEGHLLFGHGFDSINGVHISPETIKAHACSFIGWSCSIVNQRQFTHCYNPEKFGL